MVTKELCCLVKEWSKFGLTKSRNPNQASLVILRSDRGSQSVASDLGFDFISKEDDLADKLASGSNVAARNGNGLRIIIKHPADLNEVRMTYIATLLEAPWSTF